MISFAQLSPEDVTLYQLLQGRVAEMLGQTQEALDTYGQVIAADVRPTRAEAVYRTLLLLRKTGKIDLAKATATLAAEAMLWRGNPLEVDMDKLLAELYFANKDYRLGFETAKDAAANNPESKPINELVAETEDTFGDLFLNGAADQLGDLDALSLYYDFRELTPAGAKGDEMIRNLARRLVHVDLLPQAADLLQYQIDSRLKGVAQAQVAADLALIRIADRNPEGALRALNQTRMSGLAPTLDRERRILEARSLIDADREDLALDLLARVTGRDADLLRVDGYWKAKNYAAASDMLENIYSADPTEVLNQDARLNVVKAAVGLVLAGDTLGLSRLRSKFSDRLAQSAEWPMFDYITSPDVSVTGVEFKTAAKAVAGMDSINGFLSAYKQLYPVGLKAGADAGEQEVSGVTPVAGYVPTKLRISDPATKCQPSTRTKKISLNGSEMTTGGSIIMPIDISTDATTMSMITNGRNSRKPISKARRNSEIMKAGTRIFSGMVEASAPGVSLLRSKNSCTSSLRTLAAMKSCSGTEPLSKASCTWIWPAKSGAMPWSYDACRVGCMMKKVRNSASDTITELGGAVCRPIAVRSSDSTTTMRVKLVTMMRIDGASARMVMRPTSWTARSVSVVLSPKLTEMSCAKTAVGIRIAMAAISAGSSQRGTRRLAPVAVDASEEPVPAADRSGLVAIGTGFS